jgi:hypothetical protein
MEVKNFILWLIIGFALILIIAFFFPSVSAYPYIIQGQTINQSETYDMTSVYGWTGKFAHWDNTYDENSEVAPSQIVDLNKMSKTYAIYIDPKIWLLGRWYQYDGKTTERHGNTLAFVVNRTQPGVTPAPTPTPTKPSTPTATPIPINEPTTVIPLPATQSTPKVPVVSPSPTFPPPRGLPSSPAIPAMALLIIIGYILLRD